MGKLREVLEHPDELVPLIQMAYMAKRAKILPKDESLGFCYDMLNRVSRRCTPSVCCAHHQAPHLMTCQPRCIYVLTMQCLCPETFYYSILMAVCCVAALLLSYRGSRQN